MKKLAVFVVTLALASVCWGQMSSQKTQLPNNGWVSPTLESSFNHCLTTNEQEPCWISAPGNFSWIDVNSGFVMAVDSVGAVWEYTDLPKNSWTKHPEFGTVKEITRDSDGNFYALEHYVSGGQGYALSKWTGSAWTDVSCCFQSMSMKGALMVAYDINGTIWVSTNYGASPYHQAWCDPDGPAAIAAQGIDGSSNPTFYVACSGTNKIWMFANGSWAQLPGAATKLSIGVTAGLYIVGTNGDVQHFNGSTWDDLVTNKPVGNLSVFDDTDVWMTGPVSNGANIYRFWENGTLFSHNYDGSVSCGPGVPTALCNTFVHTVHHQICYGGHCGPLATSQWNGNGSWGPSGTVFARPQDLWNCLLNGGDPQDCQAVENEGEMSCSGGGSNVDSSPSYSAGISVDDVKWLRTTSATAPVALGTIVEGDWTATVRAVTGDACPAGTRATCDSTGPVQTDLNCPYTDTNGYIYCSKWTWFTFEAYVGGEASPWVQYVPWVNVNGSLSCFPGTLKYQPHWGDYLTLPPCE